MIKAKFKQINDFFGSTYARFDLFYDKPGGAYVFSDLTILNNLFTRLFEKKIISHDQSFLETGSGDGRVVALASLYGLKSYGIELGKTLSQESINNIDTLKAKNILKSKPKIVQGNFFDDSTYEILEKPFSDFNIIFNYQTEIEKLIQKSTIESKTKSILILYLLSKKPLKINNYELELSFKIPKTSHENIFVYWKK